VGIEAVFTEAFLIQTLSGGINLATPLLFAALGEAYAEKSGVMNLGVEGTMLVGAFFSFWGACTTGNLWIGVALGLLAGAVLGFLMAFATITLGADQIVTGIAVTLFGIGISIFLHSSIFGISSVSVTGFQPISIPLLSQIPILGPVLFQNNVLVYIGLVLVPIMAFILFKTRFGLSIQAVGENPVAADSVGIKVYRTRYICVVLGGALAGLAGGFLSIAYLNVFVDNMTAGRGWIAVVIAILGQWNPVFVLGGALLFGVANSFELRLQTMTSGIYTYPLTMLPYLIAVIALVIVYRRKHPPAALGKPFRRE
jgi:simple sugar transport system permease protein